MIVKKCLHGRGLTGAARARAWRKCGCSWWTSVTVQGVREYVNLGRDETAALAAFHRLAADNTEGKSLRTRPGRDFTAVADDYQRSIESAAGAKPNSVRTVRTHLVNLRAYWEDVPVDGITIEQVRVFIDDMSRRFAPNYASALYSAFRAVMAHAQDHGLVDALPLPARSRIKTRRKREPNHLTLAEAEKLFAVLPAPYDAMAEVALLTGLRVGELAALDGAHIDRRRKLLQVRGTLQHDGTIGVPKTHHGERAVPLSPRALKILAGRPRDGRVFPVKSLAMCGWVMRHALDETGLWRPGRGWHGLRHLHTALLEESGLGIREAAARLGHGPNFVQTASYGWAAEAGKAADIDRMRVRRHREPSGGAGRRRDQAPG